MSKESSSKKGPAEEKVLLGRVGSNLQIGIVGLPNVGKSTFFNVITNSAIPAENFPFCTIDPNQSRVAVPDDRYDFLVNHFKPASAVPAFLQITDIAGLVKGASEGQGLGNAFLSHIRAVDGIFHLCRVFDDTEITHVEGNIDPIRDIEIIVNELLLKDLETVNRKLEELTPKRGGSMTKEKKEELAVVQKVLAHLEEKKEVRKGDWKAAEVEVINTLLLLTAKPVIFLVNMSMSDYLKKKNRWLPKLKEYIDSHGGDQMIPFSAQFENTVVGMTEEQRKSFCEENKVISMLPKIIKSGYHALSLAHFFTAGEDEVKCWTIRAGTKAPQAAGKIHTDFEKGFICAEVMAFNDFKEHGSEAAAKSAGKYKQQGKGYTVEDGDIIFFKFNAGAGLQKKKK